MISEAVRARFDELAHRTGARGCTSAEIDAIRTDQGVELPDSYRYFLQVMGRDAGGLFFGSAIASESIAGIRRDAVEVIRASGTSWQLPDDAVVVMEHQGYEFRFMRASEGSDPAVWIWLDITPDRDAPTRIAESLLAMLEHDPNSGLHAPRR